MDSEQMKAFEGWLKFLNPRALRANLTSAAMYLAAWETFKHGVIRHIEDFYCVGFGEEGERFSSSYAREVLARDRSRFRASMLWLKESGAITDADIELADRARKHRNEIAHNLPAYLARSSHNVDVELLHELRRLIAKIDVWWIRNIEIPTNPDLDGVDANNLPDSEIKSGNMLFLDLMFDMAHGGEAEVATFYDDLLAALGRSAAAAE